MKLEHTLEALLFAVGESLSIKELSKILSETPENIERALDALETSLEGRGIVLIRNKREVGLASSKEISHIIEVLRRKELSTPLSRASFDTLSIVLYCAPIEKKHIDMLRGVDSRTILRTLKTKGYVYETTEESRVFIHPTLELIRFLGIRSPQELSEYSEQRERLLSFIEQAQEKE